jgi:pilus assembly protein CpaF
MMPDGTSSRKPLQPQPERGSNLLRAIIESLLDELELTKHYQDPDRQLEFFEQLEQKLGFERGDVDTARGIVADRLEAYLRQHAIEISEAERQQLLEGLCAELLGFGLLEPFLADESITEIMVNGPHTIFVERQGRLEEVDLSFENDAHLMRIINRILEPLGRRPDESSPIVEARLADGSRVHVIIPPLSLVGPTLTIRKFPKFTLTFERLVAFGTLTEDMVDFLRACIAGRLNLIIAGGVGSGKATLGNRIAEFIPAEERIVTIEETAELRFRHKHVVALESRPPDAEGKGGVTLRDLVITCRRMRPDRVLIGELLGSEVLEVLRLMDMGFEGTMSSIHANSPQEALERIEMMVKMSDPNLPVSYLRSLISSAIDLVVQQSRLEDGSRKVTRITEVLAVRGGDYELHDVFVFQREGFEKGRVVGKFESHPVSLGLMRRMEAHGIILPPSLLPETAEGQD